MGNRKPRVLLVDDDKDILEILGYNLEVEGFKVLTATDGTQAVALAKKEMPEVIVLDVMMPKMDGVEVCEQLRRSHLLDNTVIAMLSARGEDFSQLAAYEAGADEYITKPIKPRLFVAKIKALLRRRIDDEPEELIFKVGDLLINRNEYRVVKNGKELSFAKKEFEILALMASTPNKVFKRKEILNEIWGGDDVDNRTVDVHITKLRKKVGEDHFETLKGVGYRFIP
ncbi:MAG: response regulator transcription factor [Allomuricauda sp.]